MNKKKHFANGYRRRNINILCGERKRLGDKRGNQTALSKQMAEKERQRQLETGRLSMAGMLL